MKHIVKMPRLEGVPGDVVLLEWLVSPGDSVQAGQNLLIVETDKVTVEVPSPVAGRVLELLAAIDEAVEPGTRLCAMES